VSSISGSGDIKLGSYTLTAGNSSNQSYSGVISGAGSLTKQGLGELTLSGLNTFTGSALVDSGTLTVTNSSSTPSVKSTSCVGGASSNRCAAPSTSTEEDNVEEQQDRELVDVREIQSLNEPIQNPNSVNFSFSELAGPSSSDQLSSSDSGTSMIGNLSLVDNQSIEGVDVALGESFVLGDDVASVADTSGNTPNNSEDAPSKLASGNSQDTDSGAKESSSSNSSSKVPALSKNIFMLTSDQVKSGFSEAEKDSSKYASRLLNLTPPSSPPSISELQSNLSTMRNNIVNAK
jgi:autotransporter-associated beta strand protein